MSNIIQFPTKKNNWEEESKAMREILESTDLNKQQINEFLNYFKPIYNEFEFSYAFDLTLPKDLSDVFIHKFNDFISAFQKYTAELRFSRFRAELYFYINNLD